MIYLDNNATTQIDPEVIEEMMPFLTTAYANPSSGYQSAVQVRQAVEHARGKLAAALGCKASEIIFTSGGTEANNAAINSALQFEPRGKHIVTSAVEHSAVKRCCEEMARRGCEVTFVGVDRDGNPDIAEVENAIRANTAIVSIMWANNETGVLFPVEKIAGICREKRVLFHTDAVQAFGKVPLQLSHSAINFLSLAAHKFHGPKGVGALYVSERSRFKSSVLGGSHEDGRRAGTENVASIVGMGKASERAAECLLEEQKRVGAMRDEFERAIGQTLADVTVNGAGAERLCNTSSISFAGVESQAALMMLDRSGICCSAGSACKTGSQESSHVLRAMKVAEDYLRGTVRFSFGRFNSEADLSQSIEIVRRVIGKLRGLAPVRAVHPVI
jgi:cysteine desulfurase